MTRFFWVRHGPTHARTMIGWSDMPADLSDKKRLSRVSAHLPKDASVISSDLSRAVATADAIENGRDRHPHNPDLREIHFGEWEMKAFDKVEDQPLIRDFWNNPGDARPPGGESWNQLSERVNRAVENLAAIHKDNDIVVVAHLGAILTQVRRALGISPVEAFSHRIDNLSVTEIHLSRGTWHASKINFHP
ncbi:MAG: histidine phosphatase family protein [Roseovarius sp.]|nr:histidine phosphatase family protein [Roseovarius sp.]